MPPGVPVGLVLDELDGPALELVARQRPSPSVRKPPQPDALVRTSGCELERQLPPRWLAPLRDHSTGITPVLFSLSSLK